MLLYNLAILPVGNRGALAGDAQVVAFLHRLDHGSDGRRRAHVLEVHCAQSSINLAGQTDFAVDFDAITASGFGPKALFLLRDEPYVARVLRNLSLHVEAIPN